MRKINTDEGYTALARDLRLLEIKHDLPEELLGFNDDAALKEIHAAQHLINVLEASRLTTELNQIKIRV